MDLVMRRELLVESDIDRLRDLAGDAGVSLRLRVDVEGEVSFSSAGLGSFDDMLSYERALADLARASS